MGRRLSILLLLITATLSFAFVLPSARAVDHRQLSPHHHGPSSSRRRRPSDEGRSSTIASSTTLLPSSSSSSCDREGGVDTAAAAPSIIMPKKTNDAPSSSSSSSSSSSVPRWHQHEISITAPSRGCHLITPRVHDAIKDDVSNMRIGIANIFIQHTSASLTINENADPDVLR